MLFALFASKNLWKHKPEAPPQFHFRNTFVLSILIAIPALLVKVSPTYGGDPVHVRQQAL